MRVYVCTVRVCVCGADFEPFYKDIWFVLTKQTALKIVCVCVVDSNTVKSAAANQKKAAAKNCLLERVEVMTTGHLKSNAYRLKHVRCKYFSIGSCQITGPRQIILELAANVSEPNSNSECHKC